MGMRFDPVVRSNATALRAYPADAALTRVTTGTMRLLAVIVLAIGLSFSPWAYATMSCFVHPGGVSDAPADGDTLCWADAELPKNAVIIKQEVGLFYLCEPSWIACGNLMEESSSGSATPVHTLGGSFGSFNIEVLFLPFSGSKTTRDAGYQFFYDANAKPKVAPPDVGVNAGSPCKKECVGNPVHVGTGNNYERETDYISAGVFPLRFERFYNSILGTRSRRDGWDWKHTYDRAVFEDGASVVVTRETGRAVYFEEVGGVWVGNPGVPDRLERLVDGGGQPTGWQYADEHDSVEIYDNNGLLLTITTRTGFTQTLTYDASNQLTQVTGPFGRTLTFTYDVDGQLDTMTDPASNIYGYAYNANGKLDSVTYPDETPGNPNDNPTRQYNYNDLENPDALTGITNENGVVFVTWTYDSDGRVTANSRAGGADSITITYDDVAGTSTLTDALGEVRTFSFETLHDQIHVATVSGSPCTTGCGSQFASYSNDANGYPASRTDHNGNVTTFVHDAQGLETSRTEAVGTPQERTVTMQWHTTFRLSELITELGKTTAFTYDTQGRLMTRTETDTATDNTRTVTNTYNAQGLLATRDGPRTDSTTDITTFTYDAQGNLTDTTNALGHISQVTAYDAHGRPLTLRDPNGLVTTLTYDARSRLLSRDVGGQLTTFEYDGVGNVTKTTLPDGSFLVSEYDDAQRLDAIEDNLGNRTKFKLDAAGNRVGETVRDPSNAITRTRMRIYDALNRLTQDIGGAGQTTNFEYDLQGNQTAVVDGNTERTTSEYDALNRLAKSIEPNLGETVFGYDARDNLVSVTDTEGLATTFTYDGLENLTDQSSPDTGLTQFTYDDAGNRITQTDARGVLAQFNYDALNRLVSIAYPDTTKNVGFEYDLGPNGIGRLTRMTDESGSADFVYDIRGNLLSETRTIDGVAYATAYTFDSADRVLTITYPSGTLVTYTRDALGRIDAVSATTGGATQTLASNIAYLPFGPMEGFDYGNGIALSRVYDQDYRLTSQTAGVVQDISLGYDPADNITTLTHVLNGARDQIFTYDSLNRLTQGQGIYGTQDYSYDGIGNRLTLTTTAGVDTYSYGSSSHRLDAITGPNPASFTYDANGNTVVKGPLGFTYDDTNRMTEALASGIVAGAYVYNAKGERVKKTASGTTTVFHYDVQGQLIAESDVLGHVQREYVYLNGQPLAGIEPAAPSGPTEIVVDGVASAGAKAARLAWSHTVGVGEQRLLVVQVAAKKRAVERIRYAGQALTRLGTEAKRRKARVELWYLTAPPVGIAEVVVELERKDKVQAGSLSFTGVDQSAPLGAWTSATGRSATPHVVGVPAGAGEVVIDVVAVASGTKALTPDAPQRLLWEAKRKQRGKKIGAAGSALDTDGATDVTMSWTLRKAKKWAMGAVALKPGAAATPPGTGDATMYYYHNDHLGTPKRLTDVSGTVVWAANYEPFGNVLESVASVSNNLRFPGQYFDAETGLHYNYFRFFDPTIGRYIRPDPIGLAGGVNMFGYVNANPIRFSDSSGLEGSFIGGFADADDANASGRDLVVGLIGTLAPAATILSLGAVGPTIVANAGEIGRVGIIVGRLLKGELSGPSPPEISPKPPPPNVQSAPPRPNPIPPNLRIPKRLKRSIDVRVISVGQDCR